MASDHYGNNINVGDRVVKVGFSDEFIVSNISSFTGEELLDLNGRHTESRVHPGNVIKK